MTVIQQKELRNQVSDVLRRAEAGERFTITVAGRPVAELGPMPRAQWVSGRALDEVWATPAPEFGDDLARFGVDLSDPFA